MSPWLVVTRTSGTAFADDPVVGLPIGAVAALLRDGEVVLEVAVCGLGLYGEAGLLGQR